MGDRPGEVTAPAASTCAGRFLVLCCFRRREPGTRQPGTGGRELHPAMPPGAACEIDAMRSDRYGTVHQYKAAAGAPCSRRHGAGGDHLRSAAIVGLSVG